VADHDVLVLGLDGFDIGYAEQLFDAGELPALATLRDRSRRFLLHHGAATRTGLAWEHFASGLTPEHAQRASAVDLVDDEYDARQRGARFAPFYGSLDARIVVFDPPYTDLSRSPSVRGLVGWGAHDPGIPPTTTPRSLRRELDARFGPYPSSNWTYVSPWPSIARTADMGAALVRGIASRREAARWLLTEHSPDWDLAIVVAGEPHSAAEGFWHGVEPTHPLHDHASAATAGQCLADVYRELDRLVDELVSATRPRSIVVFSMGGMGTNNSDVPSMVLLGDLVYRWATGDTLLDVPREWAEHPERVPIIPEDEDWDAAIARCYPSAAPPSLAARFGGRLRSDARRVGRRFFPDHGPRTANLSLAWIPASRYRSRWATMRAFALPSFYDGRIRVNLEGREPAGIVPLDDYAATCDELEEVLRACRDPRTGEPVVDEIERPGSSQPLALGNSNADLVVTWNGPVCAIAHPELGLVGPVPFRRTGGHTGPFGFAYVSGDGIEAGDGGVRSAFDVSPTIGALLDAALPAGVAGSSLVAAHT
jgi:predicted AlkP superfamily phosphohydrolase/phosphomutase